MLKATGLIVVAGLLGLGCGVDTNTLVCSPGKEKRGGECVVPTDNPLDDRCVELSDADIEAEEEALAIPDEDRQDLDAGCSDWLSCKTELFCGDISGGFGTCSPRCETDASCPDARCSPSGLCIPAAGSGLEGDACFGHGDCAEGLACAAEDGLCARLCDPALSGADCAEDEHCITGDKRPEGLGLCFRRCK